MLFAPSPLRGEGWGEGLSLQKTPRPLSVIPAEAGIQFKHEPEGHNTGFKCFSHNVF